MIALYSLRLRNHRDFWKFATDSFVKTATPPILDQFSRHSPRFSQLVSCEISSSYRASRPVTDQLLASSCHLCLNLRAIANPLDTKEPTIASNSTAIERPDADTRLTVETLLQTGYRREPQSKSEIPVSTTKHLDRPALMATEIDMGSDGTTVEDVRRNPLRRKI